MTEDWIKQWRTYWMNDETHPLRYDFNSRQGSRNVLIVKASPLTCQISDGFCGDLKLVTVGRLDRDGHQMMQNTDGARHCGRWWVTEACMEQNGISRLLKPPSVKQSHPPQIKIWTNLSRQSNSDQEIHNRPRHPRTFQDIHQPFKTSTNLSRHPQQINTSTTEPDIH